MTIADVPEIERNKSIEAGCPIELQCEISNPSDPVFWYKDGTELLPQNGFIIQSETTVRRLIIPSAQLCHTGVYSCKVVDDVIIFKVDVKGDLKLVYSIEWLWQKLNNYSVCEFDIERNTEA